MIKRDFHMHTKYCRHAEGEMQDYVESAIAKGLDEICFLAHLESGIKYYRENWLSDDELNEYYQHGCELREKYADQLKINLGIELGVNLQNVDSLKERLALHPWDYVGMSFHYLEHPEFDVNVCSGSSRNKKEMYAYTLVKAVPEYLGTLNAALDIFQPDFLCHLDVIWRNYPEIVVTPEIDTLFENILQKMAAKGIALEINTSGFFHRKEQYPSRRILKRAAELKIPVSVGSDSHSPADVGRYFDKAAQLISELGLTQFKKN